MLATADYKSVDRFSTPIAIGASVEDRSSFASKYSEHMNNKKGVVIAIMLLIAIVFVIGADWAGPTAQRFFKSYFADIAVPFGYYFLLVLVEDKYHPFKKWYVKAIAIFALCSVSETLQYFGIYAMATVFDPLDYVMYALGVLFAAFADRIIFTRLFRFWQ